MAKYGVISADAHMDLQYLPPDLFTSRVPAQWKERVPRGVQGAHGTDWVAGEKGEYTISRGGARLHRAHLGESPRDRVMREAGFRPEDKRPANPGLRLQDQELDGIDAEVIYGVAFPLGMFFPDMDAVAVSVSAYNEWIKEFNQSKPGRFYALGGVGGNNPESAVREINHIAQLGLPGVELTMWGMSKPVWHPSWEPVWDALAKHRLPVHFHIGQGTTTVSRGGPTDPVLPDMDNPANHAAFICVCDMQADEYLASIVLCGALERHPSLKVVLTECDTGWIPYLLARMDDQWEENYYKWKEMITIKPSDLFRRQMYATFGKDSVGAMLAGQFAPDSFMWGNDYPHQSNGTWPVSRQVIQKCLGGIDAVVRQKLVHDNAAALYHVA